MKKLLVVAVLALSACGGIGTSNVAACKSLITKLQCGSAAAPLTAASCEGYVNTTCDFSSYFRCLEGAYVCVNNSYDTNKLAMASSCSPPVCR